MTKKIFIFNAEKASVISVMDYDTGFETNLKSGNIPFKVLDVSDDQYYYGDFATGAIRSVNSHPILNEVAFDTVVNKEILIRYPVHTQLNIISSCLEQAGIPLTPEFVEMRTWINQKISNHNEAKSVYSSNTDVYSWVPKPEIPTE